MTAISGFSAVQPATALAGRDESFGSFATSRSDEAALTGALGEIDAALARDFAKPGKGLPEAFDLASRIDDIIGNQVKSGKLTSHQADTLRTLLAGDESDSSDSADEGYGSNGFATVDEAGSGDPILAFLRQVQDAQAPFRDYAADGTTNSRLTLTSLLFNDQV